jgi:hypothetical protein
MRTALFVFAISVSLSACVHRMTQPELDAYCQDKFAERAAFELSCPRGQLAFQCLARGNMNAGQGGALLYRDACVSWGVSGCGARAVYVSTSQGFVNNTGVRRDGP